MWVFKMILCLFIVVVVVVLNVTVEDVNSSRLLLGESTKKQKVSIQEFKKKMMESSRQRNNSSPMEMTRRERYEHKKVLREKLRKERIINAEKEFNARIEVGSPLWLETHPLAKFCKNFSDVSRNKYFDKILLKNETLLSIPCIPAVILPIALDPNNYTARLFKSIDHCIENLYIYKSNQVDLNEAMEHLNKRLVRKIIVRSHDFPMKLSQAWNSVSGRLFVLFLSAPRNLPFPSLVREFAR